jgi:ABC-type glutathione transport system ATPase component
MLTGRENVYVRCSQLGLPPSEVDARLSGIVDFAGLHEAIDRPVRHYSDGMYARLDFAIATSGPVDVLLVDEVLAVGDIAFQKRCLDRLNALKRAGTAVVLVSHAEMNVRYVAYRCLLLLDGKVVALGDSEAVIRKYHEAVGYLNAQAVPCAFADAPPVDEDGAVTITALHIGAAPVSPGDAARWTLEYCCAADDASLGLVLQFWNSAELLVASIDTRYSGRLPLTRGTGRLVVGVSFLSLAPGRYRVAAGFVGAGGFVAYRKALAMLHVADPDYRRYGGLTVMPAAVTPLPPSLD